MLEIFLWILLFIVGYFVIYYSADIFLDNLKALCLIYNVSPFIVGLLVLGIDPEESIASIIAAINGLPYIAIGNVIGNSIIAMTIPFALPALFHKIKYELIDKIYFNIIYISIFLILISFLFYFGLIFAGILCILIYVFYLIRSVNQISTSNFNSKIGADLKSFGIEGINEQKEGIKFKKFIFIIISLTFIILGGELLIISAENIINLTHIPESFFGFVIIAIVTNVEELTLMIKSIEKKSVEIGIGGMIGKLIWNLTFTFGISGIIIMNINFTWILIWNWFLLLILSVYFNYISIKKKLSKIEGITLISIFLIFIIINFFLIM